MTLMSAFKGVHVTHSSSPSAHHLMSNYYTQIARHCLKQSGNRALENSHKNINAVAHYDMLLFCIPNYVARCSDKSGSCSYRNYRPKNLCGASESIQLDFRPLPRFKAQYSHRGGDVHTHAATGHDGCWDIMVHRGVSVIASKLHPSY